MENLKSMTSGEEQVHENHLEILCLLILKTLCLLSQSQNHTKIPFLLLKNLVYQNYLKPVSEEDS